jgi:hypothetical protein
VLVPLPGAVDGDAGQPDAAIADTSPDGPGRDRRLPPPSPDVAPTAVDDGGTCWEVTYSTTFHAPQAIIAFDRSSTMAPRIEPLRAKLIPALTALGPAVQFGYLEFPDQTCDSLLNCCNSTDVLVKPAFDSAAAIGKSLATCTPAGRDAGAGCKPGPQRTPTDDALRRVASFWDSSRDDTDRFVVLITDGPPNCDGDIDSPCFRAHRTAEDISRRIKTVILAVSKLTVSSCLGRIALDGGNVFKNGTSSGLPFVWIDDVVDPVVVNDAVTQVLSPVKARTCVVKLGGPRDRVSDVVVRVDKMPLGYDQGHSNGWDFVDSPRGKPTEIRIFGDKCKQILSGVIQPKNVEAIVTCRNCGRGINCG